jgi:hypothetical protein
VDDPPSPLASIEVSGEGNAGEDGVAEGFHVREEDLRRAWRGREQDKVASKRARRTVDFDAACHVMMQVKTFFLDFFHVTAASAAGAASGGANHPLQNLMSYCSKSHLSPEAPQLRTLCIHTSLCVPPSNTLCIRNGSPILPKDIFASCKDRPLLFRQFFSSVGVMGD